MKKLRLSNQKIADGIRREGSIGYQAIVPAASQAGLEATADAIFSAPGPANEFTDALINRIGSIIGQTLSWQNPLAQFKSGKIEFGVNVEEYHTDLLKIYSYDPDEDALGDAVWGQKLADTRSIFHQLSRQDRIDLTVNHTLLRRAFLGEGELSEYVSSLMAAAATTDQWSEYLYMIQLLRRALSRDDGMFRVQVADLAASVNKAADTQDLLCKVREYAEILTYPSTLYNPLGRTVFARMEDLVLFCTPAVKASIDVRALSAAFNRSDSEPLVPIYTIPQEQFEQYRDVEMVLTSRHFFRVFDTFIGNTSIDNPVGLYKNYFFHHHQIVSQSLFVPAVAFVSSAPSNTERITITPQVITEIKLEDGVVEPLKPGQIYQLRIDEAGKLVENPAVVWSVIGGSDSKTRITQQGVLHVAVNETAAELAVSARPVDVVAGSKTKKLVNAPAPRIFEVKA